MRISRRIRLLAAGLVACTFVAAAQAQKDTDFLAAKLAYERGDTAKLAQLVPALSSHVLAPYAQYWQLKLTLDRVEPATVRAFLSRYAGVPVVDQLRNDWLKLLAARGQWVVFGEDFVQPNGEDVELACHAIAYRRFREGDGALAAARPLWFVGRNTPDACEPLFAALILRGDLTIDDRRSRVRLASENGNVRLAQSIAATLPEGSRIVDRDFGRMDRDPIAALVKGEFDKTPAGRELALFALERAARKDIHGARAAWVKFRAQLPEPERQHGNARLAFHAARQHVHDAHVFYREAKAATMSDEQHAWRARAALRAQAWPDVLAAVEAMPAAQKEEAAWRYWRARAQAKLGMQDASHSALAALAKEFHFYGLLAAESLGSEFAPKSEPLAVAEDVLNAFGARADVRRAVKLAELDMRTELIREWAAIIRYTTDEALLMAAEFARRAGLPDRAINTAERTSARHDFALRYLMPYRSHFEDAARQHDIDSAMLFAIARQESRFMPTIVSSAGAQGLMQLMPGTARWVAKQLGESGYHGAQITDIDINTRFGAYYFRYWLGRLDNHAALTAAAYNAGPGRAQAWRPPVPLEGAAWVETIPFNETRDYVKKVLANAMFYTYALGKPSVSLTARLGTVTPRATASAVGGSVAAAN
ncbi:MAG TPA: transglycosylase SLT domain-containing protein [Casimicrobiaceae bacterium]|nr:transglycosylase SLT domain-containing protein [Casimicrobiaceae bacterium]